MTPVERDIIEKAKVWRLAQINGNVQGGEAAAITRAVDALLVTTDLIDEHTRELLSRHLAESVLGSDSLPSTGFAGTVDRQRVPPRPGKEAIPRRPKKLSRREQFIESRRKSDRTGAGRTDIDYSSTEDPEG